MKFIRYSELSVSEKSKYKTRERLLYWVRKVDLGLSLISYYLLSLNSAPQFPYLLKVSNYNICPIEPLWKLGDSLYKQFIIINTTNVIYY